MNTRPLYLALILVNLHAIAHAQIFKCKGANGHYTFQDVPCVSSAGSQARKRPKPGERNEDFAQRKKDDRPGANWMPRTQIIPESQLSPPQHAAPAQINATRSPAGAPARKSWQEKELESQRRQAEERSKEIEAYNNRVSAYNRMQLCNHARQQLGVIRDGRPAFIRDNDGNRHYVKDSDRQAKISAEEQRVAETCK